MIKHRCVHTTQDVACLQMHKIEIQKNAAMHKKSPKQFLWPQTTKDLKPVDQV